MNQALTLNMDCGSATWFALGEARKMNFVLSQHESWTSDRKIGDTPPDVEVLWRDKRNSSCDLVVKNSDAIVLLNQERRTLRASVYSDHQDKITAGFARLRELFPQSEREPNLLDVTFWYQSQHGPRSYDRQLQAPTWGQIKGNYPSTTQNKLTALQGLEPNEASGGKLLLWQGEPGTGKTFALRALAEEWASWCRLHYVLDPERFFAEGDYLLSVILGTDELPASESNQRPPWRLVVLEDAGEMLARDAKMQVGQGLARLLNLCDGLLGQGLRVLVLITTNEHVGTLHAAVSRPGRCLSQIIFDKFDSATANNWLKEHGSSAGVMKGASLAELFALSGGSVDLPTERVVGF